MNLTKDEYLIFTKLTQKSRNALSRKTKKGGKPYNYIPRGNLIARLSKELSITKEAVYNILIALHSKLTL